MIEHAMTRGLLLSVGIDREANAAALRDSMSPMGWGLPFAWDPFRKGILNPPETAYACTTAIVLAGFLDAGLLDKPLANVALAWARRAWSDFYWYSEHRHDAIYTSNAVSLLAGVTYRLAAKVPEFFFLTGAKLLRKQANEAMRRLAADVQPGISWRYSERSEKLNGLIHDGFTLWGIETYREAGGKVSLSWTPLDAVAALAGRTDVGTWPAGSRAMRYALAARFAPSYADPVDLKVAPASERDAAFQAWARSYA